MRKIKNAFCSRVNYETNVGRIVTSIFIGSSINANCSIKNIAQNEVLQTYAIFRKDQIKMALF